MSKIAQTKCPRQRYPNDRKSKDSDNPLNSKDKNIENEK